MNHLLTREQRIAMTAYKLEYRGYVIRIKQDFGNQWFLINGMPCMWGYVVCYGKGMEYEGCNAMPAATWFQTVQDAKHAIDTLINSLTSGAERTSDWFWKTNYRHNDLIREYMEKLTREDAEVLSQRSLDSTG